MANIIEMPKLSDTMTVGTLVKWLKKEGEAVKSGDMLAEVETDKATMELECFFDGTLLKIFVPAGSQVPLGAALCAVGKAGEKVEAPSFAKAPEGTPVAAPVAASAPAPQAAKASAPSFAKAAESTPVVSSGRIKISPLARKLAAAQNIDAATVAGSGPGGRIVRADILAAAEGRGASTSAKASADLAQGQPSPTAQANGASGGKFVPASNMRATVARRLLEAKTQIPHFYLDVEVDAAPLLELRAQLNASLEADKVKLSVNDFILKACAEALIKVPAVNCSWEVGPPTGVRQHEAVHVSFAVAIDDGLITPVIRNTTAKSLVAVSSEAKALAKRAKEKKLAPNEYTGGTFCVSNLGMMGVDRFCAIINPPNAAILAVGATVKKPVVRGDQIVIGQRMTLTLSCDHRVVDGAVGATFLAALRELIEKPSLLLL